MELKSAPATAPSPSPSPAPSSSMITCMTSPRLLARSWPAALMLSDRPSRLLVIRLILLENDWEKLRWAVVVCGRSSVSRTTTSGLKPSPIPPVSCPWASCFWSIWTNSSSWGLIGPSDAGLDSVETVKKSYDSQGKPKLLLEDKKSNDNNSKADDDESIIDVSGKNVDFPLFEGDQKNSDTSVKGLYLYKNVYDLIPKSVGGFGKLKILKFFGNEINLLPTEVGNLVGLECLQVKISSPGFNGFALDKLKGLKELELSKVPPRPSFLTLLSEIGGLNCLTKLSVCHFSIRYLPPEVGCLTSLEHLDLSFNKLKNLPTEITHLKALITLKIANNKLVELPPGLSSLQKLVNLDLSNNRLTSLGSLELGLMHNLQNLNLQYNKLLSYCQVPSWICCNLEGNGRDSSNDDFISSSVEMDVYESSIQEVDGIVPYNGVRQASSSVLTVPSSIRCYVARKSSKRWKRKRYSQQKARQERLNISRKWKGDGHRNVKPSSVEGFTYGTHAEGESGITDLADNGDKKLLCAEADCDQLLSSGETDKNRSGEELFVENCSSVKLESTGTGKEVESLKFEESSVSVQNETSDAEEVAATEITKASSKTKRHSDKDLDNPKPCKSRKPTEDSANISQKYSFVSFCSIEDRLPDGFYDAGRDRPFLPLRNYEEVSHLDSREVIVVDRRSDEELDAIALSAQGLVSRLKLMHGRGMEPVDNLHISMLLALFVSDHFGGTDRSAMVERTRKSVSGSNYRKPFVCTCSTGSSDSMRTLPKTMLDALQDIDFADLCEKSLSSIKSRRNSIVVPIGTLQFGVCRHRALLMKYLCDRMEPPIPCELVRGYLDFRPHAWNIILVRKGDSWVRMIVDACRPHDVREETDPEYFCRYIPLRRSLAPLSAVNSHNPDPESFPSLTTSDEIEKTVSRALLKCRFGLVDCAAKVRILEVSGSSVEEIKNFEYGCLGEVRILGALKHPCIVEMYGHQISSKWIHSVDGNPENRILQSAIFMEYIKGGSLKRYLGNLSEAGEKRVPLDLALFIAHDVASALLELHLKHIIHRDIKSENILIDVDPEKADGRPVVKLCDFDRAVPLRSFLHSCCISHMGVPPPDVCVGTPRWMAPEVLRAMHKRNIYGLEVDIWSYGCLIFELLTLQVPYSGLSDLEIYELLQMGKRPKLTDELEAIGSRKDIKESEPEMKTLSFLVDLFRQCTVENPCDRPTAGDIYEMLHARTSNLKSSKR